MMNHFKLKVAGLYIVFLAIYQKYSDPWYWYARNCVSWHLCVPDFDAGGIHNANLPVNAFCKYKTGWSKSGWWLHISMVYVVFILWLVLWSRVTHIHIYRYIKKKKNRISWKRSIFLVTYFRNWNPYINRFITHGVKYVKLLFLEILMIMACR